MINRTNLKFYLIPVGILLILFIVILIIPFGSKKTDNTTSPTPSTLVPTKKAITPLPSSGTIRVSPTLVPPQVFTGAAIDKPIPQTEADLGSQKTALRRKAPFALSFGTISFDYDNDRFALALSEPKDQSKTAFTTWLKQNYPAIPVEQFAIQ